MGKVRKLGVWLVAVATVGAAVPTAALACDPGATPQEGLWNHGWCRGCNGTNAFSDVEADILVKDPFVYDDPNSTNKTNFSYSWIMLADSAGTGWAQIGPAKVNDRTRWDFIQCKTPNQNNGIPDDIFLNPETAGASVHYEVHSESDGKHFMEGGNSFGFCAYTFTPQSVQVANEVHNRDDQVQGISSSTQTWTNTLAHLSGGSQVDVLASGSFMGNSTQTDGSEVHTPASWDVAQQDSSTKMEGWDTRC